MQKRIACRLVNVIPNLVNGYKQWQLKFLACGVLYHRVIHPELHDNVVLRQVFPYGFGLSEQDKRRIVQLSVFQQIQIRQHLFVGVSPEKWIFLFTGILALHFRNGFLIQIPYGKPLAYLGREIRFLFRQYPEYFGIGHFTQAFSGTHERYALKPQ